MWVRTLSHLENTSSGVLRITFFMFLSIFILLFWVILCRKLESFGDTSCVGSEEDNVQDKYNNSRKKM